MTAIEVRRTRCGCHPETCSCQDWQVFQDGRPIGNSVTKELADLFEAQEREVSRLREALCKIDMAAGVFRDDVSYLQTAAKKALEPPQ